jgi:multimeric flavodoxin WrbA
MALKRFKGKYTAALSTSIHFYDHLAHNYIHAICDDLGMKYSGAFSAEAEDLLKEARRRDLGLFAGSFFEAIETGAPTPRSTMPALPRQFDYLAGPVENQVDIGRTKIALVTDVEPGQANLARMVERFGACFPSEAGPQVAAINLHDLDIRGGCLGCLRCGYDNRCAYTGKDGYVDFYDNTLKTADVIVFAGAVKDRFLSARWKTFFDRSYFNTNTPSLTGKQFGLIISGPLSQNPDLRQFIEAYAQFQRSNLAGWVTDEVGDSAEIDGLLQSLAERLVRFSASGYVEPPTFLGVGGAKIMRDAIWSGLSRSVFRADYRAYQRLGLFDFPRQDLRTAVMNAMMTTLLKLPGFRKSFAAQMQERMLQPYQKILQD